MTAHAVPLIGIAGPAGVGKSTIAVALTRTHWRHHGVLHLPRFRRQRFAGPLKDMLLALGLTREQVDGAEKMEPCELLCGHTPRYAMQKLGTEWGREMIGRDVWVRAAVARVEHDLIEGYGVVIDDCRFDNEAQAIAQLGGIVVQLRRDGVEQSSAHASEAGINGELIDYTVPNNQAPIDAAAEIAWLLSNRLRK